MTKYLLTGGSGKLGTELQKHLDCIAPSSKELDINNPLTYIDFAKQFPETVIHCAAFTDVPGAETKKLDAIQTNIFAVNILRQIFSESRIIYISTDYVYPGITGNYKETDKTDPFNFYGFTKLAGEALMDPYKDLIVRTSFKPNGKWPFPKAFHNLYTSADYVDVIAKEIALVIDSDLTGIINVGTERKSILELAKRRTPEVEPMSVEEVTNVKMPRDISMDLTKFLEFKSGGQNV